jgi:predicted small lipoprotein YifL
MASNRLRCSHIAAVAVLVAALGLSACGRKGPLDPPPSANASMQAAPETPVNPLERNRSRRQQPPPPPKRNDPFFLDFLLN